MKPLIVYTVACLFSVSVAAQVRKASDTTTIIERFFLPALEIGYIHNRSGELADGMVIKTSVEYRLST